MSNIKTKNTAVLYAILIHISLSATVFQLICPFYSSIKFLRPDYICILMMAIVICIDMFKGQAKIVSTIINIFNRNKVLVVLCVAYFFWDTITAFYAEDFVLLIDKYLIWAKIGVLAVLLLYYVYKSDDCLSVKAKIDSLLLNLGITACTVSGIAYVGYYTETFTCYDRMLTTIADHNFFSSGIMFGYICLCHVILFNEKMSMVKKIVMVCIGTIICVPAMYLSASRRTIILLCVFVVWFCVYVFYYILSNIKKGKVKVIIFMCIVSFVSYSLCDAHIDFFEAYSYERNQQSIAEFENGVNEANGGNKGHGSEANGGNKGHGAEAGVSEYVDTISEGSGLDLRIMIWKSTLSWFEEMTPIKKIIGGGASYHYDVFNQLDDEKNKDVIEHYSARIEENAERWMYPHNFLLEELLMGGVIKVLLVIAIMIEILRRIFIEIRKGDKQYTYLLLALYATLLGNLIMGGKFGMFGNRFTWLILAIDLAIKYKNENNKCKEL